MTVHFPALRPTSRTYKAPEFAILSPQYVATVTYPRLLGSKPGKATLSLSFENIPDADAALIIAAWMNSLTGFLPITLPPEIVSGIEDADLAIRIQTGQHLNWYFDGPPKQNSVIRGISTVQVELIGDISIDNTTPAVFDPTENAIFYYDFSNQDCFDGTSGIVRDVGPLANDGLISGIEIGYSEFAGGCLIFPAKVRGSLNVLHAPSQNTQLNLDPNATGVALSYEAWVRPTNEYSAGVAGDAYFTLFDYGNDCYFFGFYRWSPTEYAPTGYNPDFADSEFDSAIGLDYENWYHIVYSYEYPGTTDLYINKVLVRSETSNEADFTESPQGRFGIGNGLAEVNGTIVGDGNALYNKQFTGQIGLAAAYQKKLSAEEVSARYDATTSRFDGSGPALVPVEWVAGPTDYTPASISTALWVDAMSINTITVVGGALVSRWNDKSGNGRDLVNATPGTRPSVNSFAINQRNAMLFDGVSKRLLMDKYDDTFLDGATSLTIAMVMRGAIQQNAAIWSTSYSASNLLLKYSAATNQPTLLRINGETRFASGLWSTDNSPCITVVTFSSTQCEGWMNGLSVTPIGTGGITALDNTKTYYMGFAPASLIAMGEFLIAPVYTPTSERQKLEGYFAHKWGLTSLLPVNHPYKSARPTTT